jgi:hypothetical protein
MARFGDPGLSPKIVAQTDELARTIDGYRDGPLGRFLSSEAIWDLSREAGSLPPARSQSVLWAPWLLQDVGDYRGTLQRWFDCVAVGGLLIITVPHAFLYERQDAAPSRRRPGQRRIYTPRALIEEVEEAFAPNSYRLRWLGDLDGGYDYQAAAPTGQHDVAVVIERIAPPLWDLAADEPVQPAPEALFEPDRTRIERLEHLPAQRILALKLDHLGDFVMGIPALERLRGAFPNAHITLVVGRWNEGLACSLNVADVVQVFDVFPRNSSEEPPDVHARAALFDALVTGTFDLAIDLRTDMDTRQLLANVRASLKAGIGLQARFPFLDIALPIDPHIGHHDTAWSDRFAPDRFMANQSCRRSPYSIHCPAGRMDGEGAIIWGPYRPLPPGEYIFEPYLEWGSGFSGLVACDIALDTQRVAYLVPDGPAATEMRFTNEKDGASFEFRLYPVADEPLPDLRFYGGCLRKRGRASALHQSESQILLVDLIALRLNETGLLKDTLQ